MNGNPDEGRVLFLSLRGEQCAGNLIHNDLSLLGGLSRKAIRKRRLMKHFFADDDNEEERIRQKISEIRGRRTGKKQVLHGGERGISWLRRDARSDVSSLSPSSPEMDFIRLQCV